MCIFLISSFRCVLNVVCFLLGNSPASDARKLPRRKHTIVYILILVHLLALSINRNVLGLLDPVIPHMGATNKMAQHHIPEDTTFQQLLVHYVDSWFCYVQSDIMFIVLLWLFIFYCQGTSTVQCVISGFFCGVNDIFTLPGCCAVLIGSYRCFGTTCRSHLQRSGSLD